MIDDILLEEFKDEMENILDEKIPKYQDIWRTTSINELKRKMLKQTIKLVPFEKSEDLTEKEREEMKRATLHVANYCFFLYNLLGE